jgi:hypothetical protein
MKLAESELKHREGRDEMNLADFPISALPRSQKSDGAGKKLDRMELTATRYDPASRQRVQQRVTLTSTARDGLPTPADEHVILALLYVAKHSNNFTEATVHFAPSQLFDIMGWAPNGRSYTRLRDVLRRLKSLTIRYENAWWDAAGRGYEEEVATGILSAYRIARQVSGPRKPGKELVSWATWTQQFHESLKAGNIKRLDLEVFFKLSTPTAQRMYRFLDKRFYTAPTVSMDLVEFACGHIGLTDAGNVAILKRRLTPAIEELERINFIVPATAAERYQKVKAGQWRITFRSARSEAAPAPSPPPAPELSPPVRVVTPESKPAAELAREFYRLWDPTAATQPGPRDLEQAEMLLRHGTPEEARAILVCLVQVTRKEWPDCRSLSGAVQKYLGDALKLVRQQAQREAARQQTEAARKSARQTDAGRQQSDRQMQLLWEALPEEQRRAIEQQVRSRLGKSAPESFVRRLCQEEAARQPDERVNDGGS